MDKTYHGKAVENGRKFDYTVHTEGWIDVFLPRLKRMLEDEDRKCHDVLARKDLGNYHIGKHEALREVINLQEIIKRDMEIGIAYFEKNKEDI